MIIYKDDIELLNCNKEKLNVALIDFNDYQNSTEKLVKQDSLFFNDVVVYNTGAYFGYNTTLKFYTTKSKYRFVVDAIYNGNKIKFPKEKGFREFFVDGNLKFEKITDYEVVFTVPIYLKAGLYSEEVVIKKISSLNDSLVFTNKHSFYAEPTYTIKGSGQLVFSVNDEINVLENSQDGYIVYTKQGKQNVVDLSGNLKNITSRYNGNFPIFKVGENKVVLLKGESLTVDVRWRDR